MRKNWVSSEVKCLVIQKKEIWPSAKLRINRSVLAGVVGTALLFSGPAFGQSSPAHTQTESANRQFNILVLGDFVLWGEGLRPEHKSWYRVKSWLESNTGRVVVERIEAHSGAVIELGSI